MATYYTIGDSSLISPYMTSTSTTTLNTWTHWVGDISTTATSSAWITWASTDCETGTELHFRAEQDIAAVQESAQEERDRHEAAVQYHREQEAKRRVAEDRAEQLLIGHLSAEQRQQFKRDHAFVVHGRSGLRYRIRRSRTANIDVVDRAGRVSHRLCAHTSMHVPDCDNMLVQKLMLDSDELAFERVANRHAAMNRNEIVLPQLN